MISNIFQIINIKISKEHTKKEHTTFTILLLWSVLDAFA